MELTSKQRKFFEKLAQPLSPIILIGGAGVTDAQIAQIKNAFETRELLKVKFNEYKDEKHDLSDKIAQDAECQLIRIIGNIATFYKESDKENVEHIVKMKGFPKA